MSIQYFHNPFLGSPLKSSLNVRTKRSSSFAARGKTGSRVFPNVLCAKKDHESCQWPLFSHFGRRNFEFSPGNKSRSRLKMNCIEERFSRSKALVRSLVPLWNEGLLLVRCSVFVAVISAIGALVWYGQVKAKSFVEARLLPSVCLVLTEYLERKVEFGRVRRISPLGITLESCSIGPHHEEFSCGEVPTMKLRVRPFDSLRKGTIVIDAVLSRPSVLIVQKEDFTWLGIPSSEGAFERHSSTEEGIDHRTRTRRIAREEAAACWATERDKAAREAAQLGYIVPQHGSSSSAGEISKEGFGQFDDLTSSGSFFCVDERVHRRDHSCMDAGVEYRLKHGDLEKSLGVKLPGSGLKLWSRIITGPLRRGFKRKGHHKDISKAVLLAKRRNLERSAVATLTYFHGLDGRKFSDPLRSGKPPSSGSGDAAGLETLVLKGVDASDINTTAASDSSEHRISTNQHEPVDMKMEKDSKQGTFGTAAEYSSTNGKIGLVKKMQNDHGYVGDSGIQHPTRDTKNRNQIDNFSFIPETSLTTIGKLSTGTSNEQFPVSSSIAEAEKTDSCDVNDGKLKGVHIGDSHADSRATSNSLQNQILESLEERSDSRNRYSSLGATSVNLGPWLVMHHSIPIWPLTLKSGFPSFSKSLGELLSNYLAGQIQKLKSCMNLKLEDLVAELADGVDEVQPAGIEKMLPVTLDSVYFSGGTLMLLGYGDREPREMENANGHVKFQNHYGRVHVQLSGNCKEWRSVTTSDDGGFLSANVFVDTIEEKWHANLKIANLFVPLFERILEIPIMWSKGRASGEVHICMSRGETFPNLHGQLDIKGLTFEILDAPSCFSEITASLCFRGQRIFLHNASGCFGAVPLEASGDFGINPDDGEFHLMCQVPSVEVNALMKTFKMKPLLFPLAGSVTAVFNCQGPLDAPLFVGSGIVSRKTTYSVPEFPASAASEAVMKSKEAGAVAAFDRIPFSYVSANFTFNTDNCVADLYGIRATLLDGGEIRGAGNAWICPEGEIDDTAMDVNFSGNLSFDKVMHRYLPGEIQLMPLKIGELKGETKLSGSLLRPRFDIKWAAPTAEGSFTDARGDIIISHEHITVNSSSIAFDLYMKAQTSYPKEDWLNRKSHDLKNAAPLIIEGVELDFRMRGFEFFSLMSSYPFDSPRPMHLKATGRIKFQGKVVPISVSDMEVVSGDTNALGLEMIDDEKKTGLVGEVSLSGIKLNQLMIAPQLVGSLSISHENIKLDATGRPDESLAVEIVGPLFATTMEEESQKRTMLSLSLQKGQLRANVLYQPQYSANLEVRQLPLDELELASLRGTIQRAEVQLNFQKRRGHGMLSVLHPKFSGLLGESLDVAARWSGDVITIEKTILEQANSHYELQGEYVLPGTRDRHSTGKERSGLLKRAMAGHLGSVISSMGRWRMRLEVPGAETSEMLPLARLLSRSTDPAVLSRSKEFFIRNLQSVGLNAESLRDLLEVIRRDHAPLDEVILEDISLPGLAELKGRWRGSLEASGGGNGDTMADFDFNGEDWEWGTYKTQRVLAVGAYSNNDGLRLEKMFIQRDNATIHADGTLLGPKSNLHFAVLNFPVGLVPALVQVIESSATDALHSLRQLITPIKGILHMEGDLRGSLAKPECDVQVRLLDGAIGGIDLGRAEIVASLTPTCRFLFKANFEPVIQSGHVHIQGSVPVTPIQNSILEEEDKETDKGAIWIPGWEKVRESVDEISEKKSSEGWDIQLAESLKGLNWNVLDVGEVRVDADIKDGGMMLLTALCPHAKWLHGNADIMLQVRGTVEQPVLDGSASFHRASVSSPVLQKPLTNFWGTIHVKSNRLSITSLEGRVSRRGKLLVKGSLPLRTSEASPSDKIDLKCEVLEVLAKNILSCQVDSQMQVTGSILQPIICGMVKLSHGEAYLPHDKGSGAAAINRLTSNRSSLAGGGYSRMTSSGYVSRFFSSEPAASHTKFPQPSGEQTEDEEKMEQANRKPRIDIRLTDLKLLLGPELRIVYPLILNFAASGELELNGVTHPKGIKPKGILTFDNGDVNLVATQMRLKKGHINIAKFEPDLGLDPILDLALVGSEWQLRIQGRASNWQDNLLVTSTRSVEQDVLSPTEAARVFESQLAESILEGDGKLAFKKLATATLETLMPRIEGKGEFGQARWRLSYAPQIPSLLSLNPTGDPLKSLANNMFSGAEVEIQLGKRLQASMVRQIKDSEMATQWTLIYQLTSRLRVLLQSAPSKRLLFEYSATSQD
ncbi:Protein of unknown function DUF490 [Macleaya cordata]|uniref:Translocation and assembly module TamB C-terminal domain-containing protein n=1 Tax=Macleaya cordata TaxID=56857 RepID=A0A200PNA0_MACCD|nr:Protein of unknown function DUF490 [Macleaya cordata]